jgi:hypothetical protein
MTTATIRDVELVATGTWAASTGPVTITRAHLDALLAAANDPLVDHAPIRLGHIDPRFDGQPALGWVKPTRIEDRNGRATLIGDLVGMPAKLAALAPTAYRRRSAEILFNFKTGAGKIHAAVLSGLALLGITPPAVKGLADVLALSTVTTAPADGVTALHLAAGLEDNPTAAAVLAAACDGATPEHIAALEAAAGVRDTARIPPPTPDEPEPDTNRPTEGMATMPLTEDRVRELLNLGADADVEAELAKIATERAAAAPADGETTEPPGEPAQPAEQPATETPAPADPGKPADADAAALSGQVVTLSAGTLAQLQADAAAGRAAAEHLAAARRTETLDAAIRAGRIAPSERAAFSAAMDRDEEGTTTLLSSLAPRYGTTELGTNTGDAALSDAADAALDAWTRETFPDLADAGLR